MPRRGRKRVKTRTHVVENDQVASALSSNEALKIPRSLVVRRGKVEPEVTDLVSDLRTLMLPYTALNFQEDTKNTKLSRSMSHYAKELTGPLGLTHILSLSQNASRLTLRLARTPSGPTLTFKVQRFSLRKHVRATQRRPFDIANSNVTTRPPIVVTNNFGDATAAPHVKLMRITFQNMFPAINVATVKLSDCRRVVLFNFIRRDVPDSTTADTTTNKNNNKNSHQHEEEDEEVEVRHYAIRATPVGVTRRVRRIVQSRIPNLSNLDDISDYITGTTASGRPAPSPSSGYRSSGNASDSEAEDDEAAHVVLPQSYAGKGNGKSQKSALKLVEIGPRLRLKLVKVERGMAEGDVMYHAYVTKDAEEVRERRERAEKEALGKRQRREEQEENVRRKKAALEEKREAKRKRREERSRMAMEELRGTAGGGNDGDDSNEEDGSESEDEE